MSDFIISRKLQKNDDFVRFLAFGFLATFERARSSLEWFAQCKLEGQKMLAEDDWLTLSAQETKSKLSDLLRRIILEKLDGLMGDREVTMGLSAGLDSRAIFAHLPNEGDPVVTYTFGHPGTRDFDFMKKLRERESIPNILIDLHQFQWDLEEYQGNMLNTQDYPLHPRVMVETHLKKQYPLRADIHGYDMLLTKTKPGTGRSNWQESKISFCQNNDTFGLQASIGQDRVARLLPEKPSMSEAVLSFHRQLDLSFRQAQRIRPLDSRAIQYVLPYEDPRWIGFWLSRSSPELADQRLWIEFIKDLKNDVLFDVNNSKAKTRRDLKRDQNALVYGISVPYQKGSRALNFLGLKKHGTSKGRHFHLLSTYRLNKSFHGLVQESINRLKGRNVFQLSFVDGVFTNFKAGDLNAADTLKGLVSTDIMMEMGFFG